MIWRVLLLFVLAAPAGAETPLRVFAAASLGPALKDASDTWGGPKLTISAAGSGTIARQIAQGAPADIVILADHRWMDWLTTKVQIDGQIASVASNTLVLITKTADSAWQAAPGRIAIGDPRSVPAGRYAQQALSHAGIWDDLEERIIRVDNVRAALTFVARGEAAYGIVYASDLGQTDVTVLWNIPPSHHDTIRYPAAVISDHSAAHAFLNWLRSSVGVALLEQHGFSQ